MAAWNSNASAQSLRASDISILWPLKAGPDVDDVFKSKGDGFCNTLGLPEGDMLPAPIFDAYAAKVLNGVGGVCQPDTVLSDTHMFDSNESLMKPDIHLARVKGLTPGVCTQKNWKIVAFRFDPCVNLVDANAKKAACFPHVRLIAQPFEKSSNGLWVVDDFSLHLIYSIPDTAALLKDLRAVATISKRAEAAKAWEPGIDGTPVLRPHHALRNEMETCGGPASTAVRDMVLRHAVSSRLLKVAWMASSLGVKEWTFGIVNVTGNDVTETTAFGTRFDNFSDTLMMQGLPSLNENLKTASFPNAYAELALSALPALPAAEDNPARRLVHIDTLQTILNPLKVSQGQSNCTSCHLAPQSLDRIRAMYKTPTAVGSGAYAAQVWAGFLKVPRSFVQLRNFGYGPKFNLNINRRVINETVEAVKFIEANKL